MMIADPFSFYQMCHDYGIVVDDFQPQAVISGRAWCPRGWEVEGLCESFAMRLAEIEKHETCSI